MLCFWGWGREVRVTRAGREGAEGASGGGGDKGVGSGKHDSSDRQDLSPVSSGLPR